MSLSEKWLNDISEKLHSLNIGVSESIDELSNDIKESQSTVNKDKVVFDTVKVVRCEYCPKSSPYGDKKNYVWCEKMKDIMHIDGFCSLGIKYIFDELRDENGIIR